VTITAVQDGAAISGGKLSFLSMMKDGPTITVEAGKKLIIDAGTEIALGGDTSALGSIMLENNGSAAAKIVFTGAGAKLSTVVAAKNPVKVTAPIGGSIVANNGTVGTDLEIYSTAAVGSELKLGYVTPAQNASCDGVKNVISGPTYGNGDTRISSTNTVTGP
jgi:hypothetical protein